MLVGALVQGLSKGSSYALVAVAVVLVYKGTKTLSVAMGEIGAFGLFVGLRWGERGVPFVGWHLSPFVTLLVAIAVGALVALLVERLVMRPLVGRAPLDNLIATLGVALFLALIEARLFEPLPVRATSPVGGGTLRLFGAFLTAPKIAAFVVAALVAAGLYLFYSRTKFGLATRAATGDATVARLLGVNVNAVYMFAWGVGGALSGAAASLNASSAGNLVPFAQTQFALYALAGAVIGGLDSVAGAIVGSLLVGTVEALVTTADLPYKGSETVAVLSIVLVTLLVRPRGIFGSASAS